jgi:hypothetical protein
LKVGIVPTIQALLLRSTVVSWLEVVMLAGMVPRSELLPRYRFVRKLVVPMVWASVPVSLQQQQQEEEGRRQQQQQEQEQGRQPHQHQQQQQSRQRQQQGH